jgi:hypothetical protein
VFLLLAVAILERASLAVGMCEWWTRLQKGLQARRREDEVEEEEEEEEERRDRERHTQTQRQTHSVISLFSNLSNPLPQSTPAVLLHVTPD